MNLHLINQQAIEAVTPFVDIQLYTFSGMQFSMGNNIPSYNAPIALKANMQLYNNQAITLTDGYSITNIYKRFFINSNITGLNRNLSTGGDYIVWTNPTGIDLKYRIIMVLNQFNVGYTEVIGVEGLLPDELTGRPVNDAVKAEKVTTVKRAPIVRKVVKK